MQSSFLIIKLSVEGSRFYVIVKSLNLSKLHLINYFSQYTFNSSLIFRKITFTRQEQREQTQQLLGEH